jgi:hypothetical protein
MPAAPKLATASGHGCPCRVRLKAVATTARIAAPASAGPQTWVERHRHPEQGHGAVAGQQGSTDSHCPHSPHSPIPSRLGRSLCVRRRSPTVASAGLRMVISIARPPRTRGDVPGLRARAHGEIVELAQHLDIGETDLAEEIESA